MKETANRGKGPICSCGIGELSLPATEEQTVPMKGETDPQDKEEASAPDREGAPVGEARHQA